MSGLPTGLGSAAQIQEAVWALNEAVSMLNELHTQGTVHLDPGESVEDTHARACHALRLLLDVADGLSMTAQPGRSGDAA